MTMRPRSEEAQRTIERTDQIIKQILDTKEIRIKPDAHDLVGPSGAHSMADMIANLMSQYKEDKVKLAEYLVRIRRPDEIGGLDTQQTVDQMMENILQDAQDFLRAIDKAYSYDLIGPNEDVRRLQDCEKERDKLEAEVERVSTDYIKLQALYEDCQRKLQIQRLR
jgi:hypothetical protein